MKLCPRCHKKTLSWKPRPVKGTVKVTGKCKSCGYEIKSKEE
jgi:uncharacterized protein (DUF983 family)